MKKFTTPTPQGCSEAWGHWRQHFGNCGSPPVLSTLCPGCSLVHMVGDTQVTEFSHKSLPQDPSLRLVSPSCPMFSFVKRGKSQPHCLPGRWEDVRLNSPAGSSECWGTNRKPQEGAAFLRDRVSTSESTGGNTAPPGPLPFVSSLV